jgi:hypothetical protein
MFHLDIKTPKEVYNERIRPARDNAKKANPYAAKHDR